MELSLGKKITRNAVILAFGVLLWGWTAAALAIEWPQEIAAPEGTIIVYQPQPESLVGNVLTGRAAMSLQLKDSNDPSLGRSGLPPRSTRTRTKARRSCAASK